MFISAVHAVTINNPLNSTSVGGITTAFAAFATALVNISGVMYLVALIIAGFYWMTAAGNSERAGTAKQIYLWSTIGLLIVLGAYAILQFVLNVLGKATIQ